jgi:NAD(P)-dependent dehydrogenase (short-subunit alcohol dehydrogenase family)
MACETTIGDVTSFEQVKAFAATFPTIDHIVYCVGVGSGKFGFPFWKLDPADWARVLDINLIGAVNVAHAFAPALVARGAGSMLVLVSVAGQIGSQSDPPYSAAKAGLINFMQCAAKDFAPHGVRVNALSPGMVQTALNESVWAASQATLPAAERRTYADWAGEKIRKIAPLGDKGAGLDVLSRREREIARLLGVAMREDVSHAIVAAADAAAGRGP